jgi:hypothetical protein
VSEPIELLYARLDERLKAIERDVRDVRVQQAAARPQWPAVMSGIAATGAIVLTLVLNL